MSHRSFCEQLESRSLLSGNVLATVIGGNLTLRGDAEANAIRIAADPNNPAAIIVSGEQSTTINGKASVTLTGIMRDMNIRLGAGDNALTIDGVRIGRDLTLTTGNGADQVRLNNTDIRGNLLVLTRGGDDEVDLAGCTVDGSTRIDTSQGADIITASSSTFGGRFALLAGAGDDTILLGDSVFESRKRVNPGSGNNQLAGSVVARSYDFNRGPLGWLAGYTDYTVGMESTIGFQGNIRLLPTELGPGRGYQLSSRNASDDLFQYIHRQLSQRDGILPNQTYRVQFTITYASNAGSNLVGIGGAPGESVFLKAGASAKRPQAVVSRDGYVSSNIDHGNQAQGGTAASTVSNIANGINKVDAPYVSFTREHMHTALIRSDAKGRLYLIVGTESGFEGDTAIYIQKVQTKLTPVAQAGQEQPPTNPVP